MRRIPSFAVILKIYHGFFSENSRIIPYLYMSKQKNSSAGGWTHFLTVALFSEIPSFSH
jgi:hypothetical protein